ncbi:MAG: endonuclease/exonuclease/phosphatase family protein [Paracoccaceae bacterium]
MAIYTDLIHDRHFATHPAEAARTGERLKALRAQLARDVPPKSARDTLLIATWNIRDFGRDKFGHGRRLRESYHYMAEIISAFDIVALQEIGGDPEEFRRLERLLGPTWDYMLTDLTEGVGGNGERMAFVFDRRRVFFRNIAGEIVLPDSSEIGGFAEEVALPEGTRLREAGETRAVAEDAELLLPDGQRLVKRRQFARTPFLAAFQAGWFKFNLCTVHLYFGNDSGVKFERRLQEIRAIGDFFRKRQEKEEEQLGDIENYILLGDFNIVGHEDETMAALLDTGFLIPEALHGNPTNMLGTRFYDQIAFRTKTDQLKLGEIHGHKSAGVFSFFNSVFRASAADGSPSAIAATESDFDAYRDRFPAEQTADLETDADRREYYWRQWRTWQMSDHLPMWVALKTDFADAYLDRVIETATERLAET